MRRGGDTGRLSRAARAAVVVSQVAALTLGCGGRLLERERGVGGSAGSRDSEAGAGGDPSAAGSAGGAVSSTGGDGWSGEGNVCPTDILASSLTNYAINSRLRFPPASVKPEANLTFEWGGVTRDMLGHELNPLAEIGSVALFMWNRSLAELEEYLSGDLLWRNEPELPIVFDPGPSITSATLFDFVLPVGEPLTPEELLPFFNAGAYPPEENTYTLVLAEGDISTGGRALMIQAFQLDPASEQTTVSATNSSTILDYHVDLHNLQPTSVRQGSAAINIDWSELMTTGLGEEFLPSQITEIRVARYDETLGELQAKFLDLELIAEESYGGAVESGESDYSLEQLVSADGQRFTGIDARGTWLLELFCGACRNPWPWHLTVLAPCGN